MHDSTTLTSTSLRLEPFLKWPGGKRWLSSPIAHLARGCQHWCEPFVGGGAVFFGVLPTRATLGDANADLVATYQALKSKPADVARALQRLGEPSPSAYLRVREMKPRTAVGNAARFIYLNRTSFNGLHRVNRRGEFNVPYGHRPPTDLIRRDQLHAAARALKAARLVRGDFARTLALASDADFVFCDPPYTVNHDNNGFLRYNERLFSWTDQLRLAAWVTTFAQRGGSVIVSNAAHREVMRLYAASAVTRFRVRRLSRMAASTAFRGTRWELLIVSHAVGSRREIRDVLAESLLEVVDVR